MKKIALTLALIFTLSAVTISCRDTKKEEIEINVDDDGVEIETDDDIIGTDDDATDPIENTIQEGVNEVQENTGLGGEDDA